MKSEWIATYEGSEISDWLVYWRKTIYVNNELQDEQFHYSSQMGN
jgi:hypothetical protein